MHRRSILKALGAGSIGGAGLGSASSGDGEDGQPIPAELEKVAEKYETMNAEDIKNEFTENTKELIEMLARPIKRVDELAESIPTEVLSEVQGGLLEAVPGGPAKFTEEMPRLSFHVSKEIPTALLMLTRSFEEFDISIATEPDASRQYAILRFDDEYGSDTIVIDEDVGVATPCIDASVCKYHYYQPCQDCVWQHKCLYTDINCCQDYCYWGAASSNLCSCPTCNNCEYHCSGGSCN